MVSKQCRIATRHCQIDVKLTSSRSNIMSNERRQTTNQCLSNVEFSSNRNRTIELASNRTPGRNDFAWKTFFNEKRFRDHLRYWFFKPKLMVIVPGPISNLKFDFLWQVLISSEKRVQDHLWYRFFKANLMVMVSRPSSCLIHDFVGNYRNPSLKKKRIFPTGGGDPGRRSSRGKDRKTHEYTRKTIKIQNWNWLLLGIPNLKPS